MTRVSGNAALRSVTLGDLSFLVTPSEACMSLFRRKSLDSVTVHEAGRRLIPTLSWPHLIALGIGAIVGTGIYTLIGVGANLAGPAVLMGAEEAERSGLVSRVVPLASLVDDAVKLAAEIAAMPPLAVIANKEAVNAAFEMTLEQGLVMERRIFQVLTATEDKVEGMGAFIEKRPGVWKGK